MHNIPVLRRSSSREEKLKALPLLTTLQNNYYSYIFHARGIVQFAKRRRSRRDLVGADHTDRAKIGTGLRNVGAETGKSGAEVEKSRQKSEA